MATVKELFKTVVGEAIKNAELIELPKDKAMAYASIASALAQAMNNSVENITRKAESEHKDLGIVEVAVSEKKEEKPAEEKKPRKTADKMKRQPKELPPEEEPKEEKKEEVPNFTSDWTDEAFEYYEKELEEIAGFAEDYGEDGLNECIKKFSSGTLKSEEDINPLNIKALVLYLREIRANESDD